MKIRRITTEPISIPLKQVFRTALRTVTTLENILVNVETDSEYTGYGSAAPTAVITGETAGSIADAVAHIGAAIEGMDLAGHELVFQRLNRCLVGNNSAKAAVDMALYDLLAKSLGIPLYRLLGGNIQPLETDITISLDTIDRMVEDSRARLAEGFTILKIKVGNNPELDIERLEQIYRSVGSEVSMRIDANQGWQPKEAVYVGREIARRGIPVELMEQPVAARRYRDLAYVKKRVLLPVYADESVFSGAEALELIRIGAVDGINIKLMKCGGIYNARKIAAIAEAAGIPCMIGSMMECQVSVTAAAHLAAATSTISIMDLDAPLFCSSNPAAGGISYRGSEIVLPDEPGLGISGFKGSSHHGVKRS
ncbi:MAG: dipeptide epimerase [Desulfofustis sp.]|nr:dipeptide epimerase [Desulfofustis sp.]